MGYVDDVRRVAVARRKEMEGELELTRHTLRRSRHEVSELEHQERLLEALLLLATEDNVEQSKSGRGLTLHVAMVEVLRQAPERRLRATDLALEINRRGLYRMRDGRPVEAQQVHARVGHNPHLFIREGTFIKLADREADQTE
jgi:hypothetical protein